MKRWDCCILAAVLFGCVGEADNRRAALPDGAETMSLLGDTLYPPPLGAEVAADREARLAEARAAYDAAPAAADAIIWLGRRTAYLGQYRDAIRIFSEGIAQHPEEPRLYRHRGHRYLSVREFDQAIRDLERAVELTVGQPDQVEPDGLPNARNIPTSTLQTNIWYHLGLAHYLKRDFERALDAYRECLTRSKNPDMLVATSHWLYMTLRRLGLSDEAAKVLEPINAELDVIENTSYHRLLLLYKGELAADSLLRQGEDAVQSATVGYGVGNWHLYNGRPTQARQIFEEILRGPQWAAFGYIAAEAEMARAERGSG